jgi:hypothetical protein
MCGASASSPSCATRTRVSSCFRQALRVTSRHSRKRCWRGGARREKAGMGFCAARTGEPRCVKFALK